MRNTRKEQMFSVVPPAADTRHGVSKCTASISEGEAKTSRLDDAGVRPDLGNRPRAAFRRRLQLAIASANELLDKGARKLR